jgi:peptide/nickel transport system permease protein
VSVAVAAGSPSRLAAASVSARRRRRTWPSVGALAGIVVLTVWVVMALGAPLLAPRDPSEQQLLDRLRPPVWAEGGSVAYPLGTDQLGRDILSRVIHGSRTSLLVGLTVVLVAATVGTSLGLLAGYYGGRVETVVMRTVDLFLAFPFLVLALSLMAVLGASLGNVILVLGLTGWVPYARTVRAETLVLRRREFVQAAVALGASDAAILTRHVAPNIIASVVVLGTLEVATAIVAEASLTFLGLGIPPSIPTWGQMLETGREYVFNAWWLTTIPGVCIFVVVLAINIVGDWLRDAWDPRLRGAR